MQAPPVLLTLAAHCARVANPQLVLPDGLFPHQPARASVRSVATRAAIMTAVQMARDRIGRSVARSLPSMTLKPLALKTGQAVLHGRIVDPTQVASVQLVILDEFTVQVLIADGVGGIDGIGGLGG